MSARGRKDDDDIPTVVDFEAVEQLSALRAELEEPGSKPSRPAEASEDQTQPTALPVSRPRATRTPPQRRLPPALDLSTALGVDATPAPTAPDRPSPPSPLKDAEIDVELAALLESHRSRPPRSPKRRSRRPKPLARGPSGIRRLATSSRALSRSLPIVLGSILLALVAAVFLKLFAGQRSTPHVRLEVLALPGQAAPPPSPDLGTRIILDTEPDGIVVFYGQQILGKTPCEADIPLLLPERIAFRLHGPRFEEWVGEIEASPAGEFLVHAELRAR